MLGFYDGQDHGIPLESVEQMRAALTAAGRDDSEIIVYPDAGHGFHADYRPSYNKADAELAWKRAMDWFASHGLN